MKKLKENKCSFNTGNCNSGCAKEILKLHDFDTKTDTRELDSNKFNRQEWQIIDINNITNYSVPGPKNTKEWVSSENINHSMFQWSNEFKYFAGLNYHMIDFMDHKLHNTFQCTDWLNKGFNIDVLNYTNADTEKSYSVNKKTKVKYSGFVCNTDNHNGRGEHWFSVFLDMRGAIWTLEFFDSQYTGVYPEIRKFFEMMKDIYKDKISLIYVSSFMHQHSETECGVYSLYYIYSRIHNKSFKHFRHVRVSDEEMYEFRKLLFV